MYFATSVVLATAASVVSASPVQPREQTSVLPLKHVSTIKNLKNLVSKGQSRIAKINGEDAALTFNVDASSGPVTNEEVTYVAGISIGGKTWQLIVDTGSSNTWCGAQTSCEPTASSQSTGGRVSVSYGSGSFSGTEYNDKVSFAGLTVNSQGVGAASTSQGFQGVDGIVGFGPVGLTQGTVSNANTVPTFMDNLYRQGSISQEVLGVYFKPISSSAGSETNGELTLGGTDTSKYTAPLTYFSKLTSGAAAPYWGISIAKFSYGSTTLATGGSGIVDTGTTLIYIPTSAYNAFLSAAGGTNDASSGLARFRTKPTQNFGVTFGSTTYTLTPDQYLVPSNQYANFGLSSSYYYAWINNGGSSGVNTIIGQKFLETYYSVYDTTKSRIGFAKRT